jgi:predicted transcriptional regulator
VQHVIRVLESLHMHRVVVTDSHGRPTGVVSLRDVLSVLVVEPRDYFGDYFD